MSLGFTKEDLEVEWKCPSCGWKYPLSWKCPICGKCNQCCNCPTFVTDELSIDEGSEPEIERALDEIMNPMLKRRDY
jgi:hypothetical protein